MIEVVYTLHMDIQQELLKLCRHIVKQAPLFQKTMPTGAKFRYLCTSAGQFGWLSDKKGFRYETHHPETGLPFPPMPDLIRDIAIDAAAQYDLSIRPESALINWYEADSKLGLHQDKTEKCDAPVISISLGDSCLFTIGGETRNAKKHDVTLASGDVLVMGAEHRYIFHGVKKILPDTAPPELGMKNTGRVNLTIRQVYP